MNYHSDCPKLNLKEYISLILNLNSIKKKKKTVEDIEFFEKYSARKPNTEWLNNITKNKK